MPDWITHIAVAWTLCMILGLKYKQFTPSNTVIVLVGALVPDFYKLYLLNPDLLINILKPIHLPIGSFIVAAMLSLFFKERKMIFLFLSLGVVTHYCLDLLLLNVGGGMYLFYPFYWGQWQLGLVSDVSYNITIISIIIALLVYFYIQYIRNKDYTLIKK